MRPGRLGTWLVDALEVSNNGGSVLGVILCPLSRSTIVLVGTAYMLQTSIPPRWGEYSPRHAEPRRKACCVATSPDGTISHGLVNYLLR